MVELRAELPDRAARMALSCVVDAGDPTLAALVAEAGACRGMGAGVLSRRWGNQLLAARHRVDHRQIAVLSRHYKVRFVVPGDEEWPSGLDDLRFVSPVQRKAGVPIGLWLRGPGHLGELSARSIAVVGSRAATPYGVETASQHRRRSWQTAG